VRLAVTKKKKKKKKKERKKKENIKFARFTNNTCIELEKTESKEISMLSIFSGVFDYKLLKSCEGCFNIFDILGY
jgi:hypothetical protein